MHVFPLQYRQLPGVNCVCKYDGGSPAGQSSVEHCTNSLSSLKLIARLSLGVLERDRVRAHTCTSSISLVQLSC